MNGGLFVVLIAFVGIGYTAHELLNAKFLPNYGGLFIAIWFGLFFVVAAVYLLAVDRMKCPNCGARISVAINNDEAIELPNVCPNCGGKI